MDGAPAEHRTRSETVRYRIHLCKRTARVGRTRLEQFVHAVLREFGGRSLLSNVALRCGDDNTVEVRTDGGCAALVHGALLLCGEYKGLKCRFRCTVE